MCSVVIHTLGHTDKGNNHNGLCCANGEARGYGPLLDVTTHPEEDLILSQKDHLSSLSWNLLLSEVYLQPSPPESMVKVLVDYSINGCVMFNKLQNTTRPRRRPRSFSKVKYVIYLLLLLGFWFLEFLVFWIFGFLSFWSFEFLPESKAGSYPWITLTGSGHSWYWLRGIRVSHGQHPHTYWEGVAVSVSEIGWGLGHEETF